jgi:hypothetical protein
MRFEEHLREYQKVVLTHFLKKSIYDFIALNRRDINNYFSENEKLKLEQKLKCFSITVFLIFRKIYYFNLYSN